ncbi:uncharacterized protein MELLADRAFT_123337 [Melampsora larici-populina 98AG31]|uniref:Secreted protein n=1 Tax=Melampsora larici-populina (strain 98AG31 / pathotype 3-4-7) TaxID=747676 RepID=F4S2X0_MELLP|nr:uncharacterized protein MELLADRAFT_123337 [Melampsora larici-populina 98AG31]EGG01017.1 secreted protein [Melampsora larici-populina 98AG31]
MQSYKFLTAGLMLVLATSVLGQNLTFVSPAAGTVVKPGQKVTLQLKFQSTSPSVSQIAWQLGLNGLEKDLISLGRPLVASLGPEDTGATYKEDEQTYYWDVTLPAADKFLDGFDKTYRLTLSQYYVDTNGFAPNKNLVSVLVNVQKD